MERPNPGKQIVQIDQRRSDIDRNCGRFRRGGLCRSFPSDARGSASVRMGSLNRRVADFEAEVHRIPVDVREYVESRIVSSKREVPAMKLPEFRARLNSPAIFAIFGSSVHDESENSANAVIVASREAEHIRHGGIAPGDVELRGTQTRRRATHVAAQMENTRLLDDYGGTSRNRFEVHVPSTGTRRLHVTRHVNQRKRKFFVTMLEIDP